VPNPFGKISTGNAVTMSDGPAFITSLPHRGTTTCSIIAGGIVTWSMRTPEFYETALGRRFWVYPFKSSGIWSRVDWRTFIRRRLFLDWYHEDWCSQLLNCLPTYIMLHPEDLHLHQHRCESFKFQITALSCELHIRIYIRNKDAVPCWKSTVTGRCNMIIKGRFTASCL